MHVFGITGPIGHGKSTLAKALSSLENPSIHLDSSMIISTVANEWMATFPKELLLEEVNYEILNQWIDRLAEVVGHQLRVVDANQLRLTEQDVKNNPKLSEKLFKYIDLIRQGVVGIEDIITEDNKDKHRAILQWLGGYLVERVSPDIWFSEIEKQIIAARENKVKLFVIGGVRYPLDAEIVRRNGGKIIKLARTDIPERELDDPTEVHRKEIQPDTVIISDAEPKALDELVRAMYQDIVMGDLLPEYNSSDFEPLA